MSIAYDNSTDGGNVTATSLTFAHTNTTLENRLLWVFIELLSDASSNKLTSVTYGGAAMTVISSNAPDGSTTAYLAYLINPASGANNVVITRTDSNGIFGMASSYYASKQSGTPGGQTSNNGNPNVSLSVTTIAQDEWLFFGGYGSGSETITVTSGGVLRQGGNTRFIGDSNTFQGAPGSKSVVIHTTGVNNINAILASFAPQQIIGSDVTGNPIEALSISTSVTITGSDVSGIPIESAKIKFGFNNQQKSSENWNNLQKS